MFSSKKKDILPERPKRPLSAYNLFYRYKRNLVLKANAMGENDKDTITRIFTTPPGLEEYDHNSISQLTCEYIKKVRRENVRSALVNCMEPSETKHRVHKKTHGLVNFVEMSRLMCTGWKNADEVTKQIFQELSQEAKERYKKKMVDYKMKIFMTNKHLQIEQHLKRRDIERLKQVGETLPGCSEGPHKQGKEDFMMQYISPKVILNEYEKIFNLQQAQMFRQSQVPLQMHQMHEVHDVTNPQECQPLNKIQGMDLPQQFQDERGTSDVFYNSKQVEAEKLNSRSLPSIDQKPAKSTTFVNYPQRPTRNKSNSNFTENKEVPVIHCQHPMIFCSNDVHDLSSDHLALQHDTVIPRGQPPSQNQISDAAHNPSHGECFMDDIEQSNNQKMQFTSKAGKISAKDMLQLISHLGG